VVSKLLYVNLDTILHHSNRKFFLAKKMNNCLAVSMKSLLVRNSHSRDEIKRDWFRVILRVSCRDAVYTFACVRKCRRVQ